MGNTNENVGKVTKNDSKSNSKKIIFIDLDKILNGV